MATILSQASGNWATGATWLGGVAPGVNDVGQIEPNHTVTIAVAAQAKGITLNGGTLVQNADFSFTDTSGAQFLINAANSGGFSSNGSAASWRKIKSASNQPTYPWIIVVYPVSGTDVRSLNFKNVEFDGNKFFIGNSTYPTHMNDRSLNDYLFCDQINPASRESALIENPIRGRTAGRIYKGYYSAASMVISGSCRYDSAFPNRIDDIQKSGQRIAFFSRYWHMPQCRIDGKPIFTQRKGQYIDWSIVLREDV